jgi:chromosome segregation ATPase
MDRGGPEGFDDDNIEDIGHPLFLPADHPLYNRLQNAFNKQLSDEYERVHLEYLEKSNNLKALEKDKEDVGVQLYGLQQQLADLQSAFEAAHDNYNNVFRTRESNEGKLASLSENLEFRRREMDELKKKIIKANDELSKLNISLNQVRDYNKEMKSEIKLTQRTTHRTEENISDLEKEKKKQDFHIDQMNEEIKRYTEQISILEAQILSQSDQTTSANAILEEARIEMDKILTSKKNLMEHWKKAVFEIQEKDKNLQKMKDALKIDEELNIKITSEISGVEKEIGEENERAATLEDVNKRMENIKSYLKKKNYQLEEVKKKIEARNEILIQSLASTQEEMKVKETQIKSLKEEINLIENNIMKLHLETRKKEDEIINKVSSHKTVSKTTINLRKQGIKLQNDLEEKEIELAKTKNEMERIKLDILNTESQIIHLEERKRDVNQEREENEKKVTKYEGRIKDNHETHEKKMHDVAKYNREFERAVQKQTVFSKAPSDAKLIHLKKERKEINEISKNLQGEFIKEQTMYVKREEYCNAIQEEITELKRKETILEQKKMRLNSQYQHHHKDIKTINTNLKNFENDMKKLNELLAGNYENAKDLQNDNINIDSEIIQKLKALEKESVGLEVQIDRLKENKAELLQEIVEAERQILLWQRNIQLEKEMQEQLDPNFGQPEITGLKKSIHLMQLQLNEVRKDQDKLIVEMERAVYKKESIQLKYTNKASGSDETKNPTQITKNIQVLKTAIGEATKGLKEMDSNLRTKENELKNLRVQIENSNDKMNAMDFELQRLIEEISIKRIQRLLIVNNISGLQKKAKAADDIKTNGAKKANENLKVQYLQSLGYNQKLQASLRKFVDDNPHFSNILGTVVTMKIE